MPSLFVSSGDKQETVTFTPGPSLRDVLDTTGLRVRSGCRGSGVCGLCRVLVEEGIVDEPTKNEAYVLSEEDRRAGVRLACQITPHGDLRVRVVSPAPESNWRSLTAEEMRAAPPSVRASQKAYVGGRRYGVAADLGTTHVSLSLWDMAEGRRLSSRFGLNQQVRYGSDVMTRLVFADGSAEHADAVSRAARDSMGDALLDICSREGYDPREIGRVTIVGNTAMLALLAKRGFGLLLRPGYWGSEVDCAPADVDGWFASAGLPADVSMEIAQPLAGFVGSDLLAGVVATELTERHSPGLLIDFGTNSEIALWDGKSLWVTSAAGGPAFEGSGVSCGMPAAPGAVYRVDELDGGMEVGVIGNGGARGLCGSGMVDLVAYLVRTRRLDRIGNLSSDSGVRIAEEIIHIMPEKKDIDMFQRAKAAIGAGVKFLLGCARLQAEDLRRVCICGVFGRYLNVGNAQSIGLVPSVPSERTELCGNTALSGCEELLLSPGKRDYLKVLRKKCKLVNLSQVPEFGDLFLDNLYLRPM